jgi:O-antigen/teichoic acid export membrane protein
MSRHHFVSTVGWRVASLVSSAATGVLALRLFKAHLTPARYGVVVVALQVMMYLPVLDLGFRTAINRRLLGEKDPAERWRLLRFGNLLYRWLSVLLMPVSAALMTLYAQTRTARGSGEPMWFFWALGVTGAWTVLAGAMTNLLIGVGLQRRLFQVNVLGSWLGFGVLAYALRSGAGLWAFVVAQAAVATAQAAAASYAARDHLRRPPGVAEPDLPELRRRWGAMLGEAVACLRSEFAILLMFSIDCVVVGLVAGPAEAAVYGTASRIFGIGRNSLQAGAEAMWPRIASEGRDSAAAVRLSVGLTRLNAWMLGGAMGVLAVVVRPFLQWYMNDGWAAGAALAALLAARFFTTGMSSAAAYYLLGAGAFRDLATYCEREVAAGVVLALWLGPAYGAEGVAAAFLASTLLGTCTPIFRRWTVLIGVPSVATFARTWARGLAAAVLGGGGAFAVLSVAGGGVFSMVAGVAGMALAGGAAVAWSLRPGAAESGHAGLAKLVHRL